MLRKHKPLVSIIVCHHVGDLLFDFIRSVGNSNFHDYEIIVVTSNDELSTEGIDGCSVQHSVAMPAEKRNIGARIARGKYLAFFDDDVEICPSTLQEMLNVIAYQDDISWPIPLGAGMVYGKLYNYERRTRFDEAGGFLTWTGFIWSRAGQNIVDEGQFDNVEPIFSGKSAACMITKKLYMELDGMDEDFGILGEESDLAWRVWLSGHQVLWAPQSVSYHKFNTSLKPVDKYYTSSRVQFNGCRNYITMLLKNLGKEHLWIVPLHASLWFFAGCAMLITGKLRQGWNIIRGIWYVIRHLPSILEKRQRIQEGRKVDERAIWATISARPPRTYFTERFKRYLSIGLHG